MKTRLSNVIDFTPRTQADLVPPPPAPPVPPDGDGRGPLPGTNAAPGLFQGKIVPLLSPEFTEEFFRRVAPEVGYIGWVEDRAKVVILTRSPVPRALRDKLLSIGWTPQFIQFVVRADLSIPVAE